MDRANIAALLFARNHSRLTYSRAELHSSFAAIIFDLRNIIIFQSALTWTKIAQHLLMVFRQSKFRCYSDNFMSGLKE